MHTLTIHDHNRAVAGYAYVYPVISRRAGGVSVGINLNPNSACNWACIYCQVPNLTRGNAPTIDLVLLEKELRGFLTQATTGDWLEQNAPQDARALQDIAFSGNGEPTSAREFPQVVALVGRVLQDYQLLGKVRVRLISNGSLMHRKPVLDAVAALSAINGEVWFKIDRATSDGMAVINGIAGNIAGVKRRLLACARRCPTWVQTCWFTLDGQAPSEDEFAAYLALLGEVRTAIDGVHLYGLARQPMQPGVERLAALSVEQLQAYGQRIRALGMQVQLSP